MQLRKVCVLYSIIPCSHAIKEGVCIITWSHVAEEGVCITLDYIISCYSVYMCVYIESPAHKSINFVQSLLLAKSVALIPFRSSGLSSNVNSCEHFYHLKGEV